MPLPALADRFDYNIVFIDRFICRRSLPSHAPFGTKKVLSTTQWAAHPASRTMHSRVQSKTFSPKASKNELFQLCVPAVDTDTQIKIAMNTPIDAPATSLGREAQLPGDAHQAIRTTGST